MISKSPLCACLDPYQPCTVVSRKVFLTNLDKDPECILGQRKEIKLGIYYRKMWHLNENNHDY